MDWIMITKRLRIRPIGGGWEIQTARINFNGRERDLNRVHIDGYGIKIIVLKIIKKGFW